MPEHGHVVCPHCEEQLQGSEATCPACSGPLFGIAPISRESEPHVESGVTTIDNVAVPTYTPPPSNEIVQPTEFLSFKCTEIPIMQRNVNAENQGKYNHCNGK